MRTSLIASLAAASLLAATTAEAAVTRSADAIPRKRPAAACRLGNCASKLTPAEQEELAGIVNDWQNEANQLAPQIKTLFDEWKALEALPAAEKEKIGFNDKKNEIMRNLREKNRSLSNFNENALLKLENLQNKIKKKIKSKTSTIEDLNAVKSVRNAVYDTLNATLRGLEISSSSVPLTNGLLLTFGVAAGTGVIVTSISSNSISPK